jgi:hypothetical protein
MTYLYKINILKLKKIKEYLIKNLKKDFIKSLNFSYSLLVLFIKKKKKSLYFYINYR